MLTRDQIFAAAPPPLGKVPVPEWGGTLRLRRMTLGELLAWKAVQSDEARAATGEAAAVLVQFCAAAEDGTMLFGEDDRSWLQAQPWAVLNRIAAAAVEHNGLTDKAGESRAGN